MRNLKKGIKMNCFAKRRVHNYFKKDYCEHCGETYDYYVLDLDHINGDNSDYSEDNLQTLCANCHRKKTYKNGDYKNNKNTSNDKS